MMMKYRVKKNTNYLIHLVSSSINHPSIDRLDYIWNAIILLLDGEKYYYRIVYDLALLFW